MIVSTRAQQVDSFYERTAPFPTYRKVEIEEYNLKLGRLRGHLEGSLRVEYNDNVFLLPRATESDLTFYPNLTLGFVWPVMRDQTIRLDVGVGYLWYTSNDRLSYFYIAPNSRLEYRITLPDARLQLVLYENIGTSLDPTTRPEISGGKTNVARGFVFRRLSNLTGLDLMWQATRPLRVDAGYAFGLDRSLSGDFTMQDRDNHNFRVGLDYSIASAWSVGVRGGYTLVRHVQRVLNNGDRYTIGPQFTFAPMQSLRVFGRAGYTEYVFDSSGTIRDTSDFRGVTFETGISQTLTRTLSHNLQVERRVDDGWEGNYTALWGVRYAIETVPLRDVRVNASLTYQNYSMTGPRDEDGDHYLAQLTAGYKLAPRWNLGLGYVFALKEARDSALDYTQNRVTVEVTHQF
jgi:hypothetical protein